MLIQFIAKTVRNLARLLNTYAFQAPRSVHEHGHTGCYLRAIEPYFQMRKKNTTNCMWVIESCLISNDLALKSQNTTLVIDKSIQCLLAKYYRRFTSRPVSTILHVEISYILMCPRSYQKQFTVSRVYKSDFLEQPSDLTSMSLSKLRFHGVSTILQELGLTSTIKNNIASTY